MNAASGIWRAARAASLRDSPDARLVADFARVGDHLAFAELVRRHGPMALGTCRRLLGVGPDAEDACQATFALLAQ